MGAANAGRLRWAWACGAAVGFVVFGWVLTAGRVALLEHRELDDLYDAQARALLDGRLDVPPRAAHIEGFVNDGRTYVYFGPVPALLRIPVFLVTDRYDGHLTGSSLLLALLVLVVASYRLHAVLRAAVRGDEEVGRREAWVTAGLAAAVVLGPPLTLASASVVYHEAILWGLALSVAGFDAVARWQREPRGRRLAVASILVTLALLSRTAVGVGPLAALVLACGVRAWRRARDERDTLAAAASRAETVGAFGPTRAGGRLALEAVPLLLALVVPVVLTLGLQYMKVGSVTRLPFEEQVLYRHSAEAREWFETDGRSLLDPVGRSLPIYFHPVGIEPRRDFPWLDFPREVPARMNDGLPIIAVEWSSSLPTAAPAFCVLTAVGVVWAVRTRGRRRDDAPLWPLLAGALVPLVVLATYPFVANRFLNDLYPLVLVGGFLGFHVVAAASPRWSWSARGAVVAGLGLLVAVGVVVNLVLALQLQRERWQIIPQEWRAQWIEWRLALPGAQDPLRIGPDEPLPPVADSGLLVVGDCEALYAGLGPPRDTWVPMRPTRSLCEAVDEADGDVASGRAP